MWNHENMCMCFQRVRCLLEFCRLSKRWIKEIKPGKGADQNWNQFPNQPDLFKQHQYVIMYGE